ncbi:MAG TPA: choice-of-anchor B family protein [Flavobacteriales bacterium]|nr:choice-of-anchor B family protein [Flavobacteriales bacterium]
MKFFNTFPTLAYASAFAFSILFSSIALGQTPCVNGSAAGYPCSNIDFLSFMPGSQLGGGEMNDLWGWTDPLDGTEYVLLGRSSGTSFVDISDPVNPVYVGNLPASGANSSWRDIKVDGNYAYIVSEASGHGMQIFDLTKLRDVVAPPVVFTEDAHYSGWGNAHNVVINEASNRAYGVGTNTSSGGLHIVDISNPLAPVIMGDFALDGYTHDAQVVNYIGPDATYVGREIAFACNENSVTIVDVTVPTDAIQLSRTTYNSQYTHQGWLTEDHRYFLSNDELDEYYTGVNTTTFIWDVSDLNAPFLAGTFVSTTPAIDHNLYTKGNLCYQSNYRAGLRITNLDNLASGTMTEVGFFDVYPSSDAAAFNGSWSNFPYFASGVVAVSHIEQGLFILKPHFFSVSLVNDFICYNEAALIQVDGQSLGAGATFTVDGLPTSATYVSAVQPDGTTLITVTGFPQGALTSYVLTITGVDATGATDSGAVTVTVYDCINEVLGCTDTTALNYEPAATIDNGSCIYPCTDITFSLTTDNYPGETTWDITDDAGAIVLSGGSYADTQTLYTTTACLEYGCYTLSVYDSYGDGMSWGGVQGSYTLTEDATGTVLAQIVAGAAFGTLATHQFCIPTTVPGCTDATACNYDPAATVDSGTCIYSVTAYIDNDGDGYGFGPAVQVCAPLGAVYSANNTDCDDTLDTVYPGAPGTGEGIDNNCDDIIDGGEILPCPADLNGDGVITVADILLVLSEFGCSTACTADVNGDGSVTVADVLVILSLFGNPC